jgi:hypothetical protein
MSFALDTNVLVYASTSASPFHRRAAALLDQCRSRADLCYLTWPTIMGYLRLATHPSIVSPPLAPAAAMANVTGLLALPQVRALGEADGFWDAYREVAGRVVARGNLVPDAHVATILRQHGVKTLYTNDADFRRFPFLEVRDPFA